jgi:hypothetical protein
MPDEPVPQLRWQQFVRRHAWWVLTAALYALCMTMTAALYMSDTVDYAGSIEHALDGESRGFWEFGHLLWRPLGYLTYCAVSPLFEREAGSDRQIGIVNILLAWNWVAGLIGALALNRLVSRLGAALWSVAAVTVAYVVTFGVLNYAHSGSSYIPGLSCLLAALALLVARDRMAAGTAIAAAIALAGAVSFWALYVLVMPAALAFPLIWFGFERRRLRMTGLVTASFIIVLGSVYLLAIQRLGIRDLASLKSWVTESSHDIVNIRGFSRVAFGIPRSFISMGKDGILFKRYLLKDPYNPVSLSDLVRVSLAKLAFFYAVLLATIIGLLRGKAERRLLGLAILGGVPLIAFAVGWQGGDVERYMPVYPLFLAAWALVLGGRRPMRLLQVLIVLLIIVMSAVNLPALSRARADRDRDQLRRRVGAILPSLGSEDRIYVVLIQDPLFLVKRDPLSAFPRELKVGVLVPLGYSSTPNWRGDFAKDVRGVWAKGGRLWISKRILSRRPKAEWDWAEGDEKSLSWSDLPAFFGAFDLGQDVGDDDGFVVLTRTPRNEQLIEKTAAQSPADRSTLREKKAA